MEQRSEEWFAARLGKVTASRMGDLMAKTRSGYAASRDNYMTELALQRITGKIEDCFTSAAMERGTDLEPVARGAYEAKMGLMVEETGLVIHPKIKDLGASPDGLVGSDGLIEIKCPNSKTHMAFIRSKKPEKKYMLQMLCQMACTGRSWCDFVSFDDRFPAPLQLVMVRVSRDESAIKEMETEAVKFISELERLVEEINKYASEA